MKYMALVVDHARPMFCDRKCCAEVVDHESPTLAKYAEDVVEKKSRVACHASFEVVENARPTEVKYDALVVLKKLLTDFQ